MLSLLVLPIKVMTLNGLIIYFRAIVKRRIKVFYCISLKNCRTHRETVEGQTVSVDSQYNYFPRKIYFHNLNRVRFEPFDLILLEIKPQLEVLKPQPKMLQLKIELFGFHVKRLLVN